MKRLLLAGLLVLPFAPVRAERDDAYVSLVGMADSASGDRGPEAGEIPSADAAESSRVQGAPSGEAPITDFGPARAVKAARKASSPAAKPARKSDDAPSVAVPAVPVPRIWTRMFASLVPSRARVSSDYEVAASTAARRARPEPAREATPASVAGSAQGLLELVAVATAPALP